MDMAEIYPRYFQSLIERLRARWYVWAVPAGLIFLLAAGAALVSTRNWKANQPLVVRDEAAAADQPGRFASVDAMQTAQETILELSKNASLVREALVEAGPPQAGSDAFFPTDDDVETLQGRIAVTAPNGSEFGRTEVIYLSVLDPERGRALTLVDAVTRQLERRLNELRRRRAASVIRELEEAVARAKIELANSTDALAAVEENVGADLGELRILVDSGSGESGLRLSLTNVNAELRQAEAKQQSLELMQNLLGSAKRDPRELLATPNQLLESQPALRKLKEGLIDAQLRTSQLLGKMSADHPQVVAAQTAELEVRQKLRGELDTALVGIAADRRVSASQVARLKGKSDEISERLNRLAALRAKYGNLIADVRQSSQIVDNAQRELAEARAALTGAETSSLLTRLDAPDAGHGPVGPSRTMILAAGLFGGLATGLGLFFLIYPLPPLEGRRANDLDADVGGPRGGGQQRRREEDPTPRGPVPAAAESGVASDRRGTAEAQPASQPWGLSLAEEDERRQLERRGDERRGGDRRNGDRRGTGTHTPSRPSG